MRLLGALAHNLETSEEEGQTVAADIYFLMARRLHGSRQTIALTMPRSAPEMCLYEAVRRTPREQRAKAVITQFALPGGSLAIASGFNDIESWISLCTQIVAQQPVCLLLERSGSIYPARRATSCQSSLPEGCVDIPCGGLLSREDRQAIWLSTRMMVVRLWEALASNQGGIKRLTAAITRWVVLLNNSESIRSLMAAFALLPPKHQRFIRYVFLCKIAAYQSYAADADVAVRKHARKAMALLTEGLRGWNRAVADKIKDLITKIEIAMGQQPPTTQRERVHLSSIRSLVAYAKDATQAWKMRLGPRAIDCLARILALLTPEAVRRPIFAFAHLCVLERAILHLPDTWPWLQWESQVAPQLQRYGVETQELAAQLCLLEVGFMIQNNEEAEALAYMNPAQPQWQCIPTELKSNIWLSILQGLPAEWRQKHKELLTNYSSGHLDQSQPASVLAAAALLTALPSAPLLFEL